MTGRNGAGKTTLLKMIAGASTPDSGSVRLGASLSMGYFAQQSLDVLDPDLDAQAGELGKKIRGGIRCRCVSSNLRSYILRTAVVQVSGRNVQVGGKGRETRNTNPAKRINTQESASPSIVVQRESRRQFIDGPGAEILESGDFRALIQ
jgi:energy-coupling factor transporter ATP-binding protein EcfA2